MASEDSLSGSEGSDFGIARAFWAVELVPGKELTTTFPFDLHITQAVLPASAKDNGRSVVSVKFNEEEEKESEKAFSLVSLSLDKHDSQSIHVIIDEGSSVSFSVSGKNPVHLSGYYAPDQGPEDGFYGDEEGSDEEIDSELEDSDDDEDDQETARAQAAIHAQLAAKRKQVVQNGGDAKKAKVESAEQPKKQQQQQTPQQKGQQQQQQQPKKQQQPQQQGKSPAPKERELPGGLKYIVHKEGNGAEATRGRRVGVKYVGKLTKNGKVFDSSKKPFVFTLGAGEVIQGWDKGVAGMKVGESRTLIIPPQLGYGKEGAGRDIPPNSSLTFEVELLHVK